MVILIIIAIIAVIAYLWNLSKEGKTIQIRENKQEVIDKITREIDGIRRAYKNDPTTAEDKIDALVGETFLNLYSIEALSSISNSYQVSFEDARILVDSIYKAVSDYQIRTRTH